MSDDDFDDLPDLFSGVSEAEWSRILDQPTPAPRDSNTQSFQQASPRANTSSTGSSSSTDYGEDSSLDSSTLAEIDRIEAHALQTVGVSSPTTRGAAHQDPLPSNPGVHPTSASTEIDHVPMQSHYFMSANANHRASVTSQFTTGESANSVYSAGEKQSLDTESSCPPAKRPRIQPSKSSEQKQGIGEIMRSFLEGYEEELSCPICCDMFVATHTGNPCGHSYCGDCGWQWLGRNKQKQCPICRATLVRSQPLIPNRSMDSVIEKHIEQLSAAGDEDWQPRGSKYKERLARKEKWKASVNTRMMKKRTHKAEIRPAVTSDVFEMGLDGVLFLPSDEDESYTEDSPPEGLQAVATDSNSGRRRRRSGRRRRN